MRIDVSELPADLISANPTSVLPTTPTPKTIQAQDISIHGQALLQELQQELRLLRHQVRDYEAKNDLQTILGGIGYILGLFGVGFYMAANRKLKQNQVA